MFPGTVAGGCGIVLAVNDLNVHVRSFDELDTRTSYLLWQLREAVFVVEQACPYQELDGRDLEETTRHVWVEEQGRPVAYLRILSEGASARIGRVLVAQGHRGHGLARVLMERALREIGPQPSVLDAQAHLAGWYEGFG